MVAISFVMPRNECGNQSLRGTTSLLVSVPDLWKCHSYLIGLFRSSFQKKGAESDNLFVQMHVYENTGHTSKNLSIQKGGERLDGCGAD